MSAAEAAHHVFQVAIIILTANLLGRLFTRWLRQPGVLGELTAGMIIGPYALGGMHLFGFGPLFERPLESALAVPSELHALAVLASAVLLFLAGLETDLHKFLRYAGAGLLTGLGGAAVSFALGDLAAVWLGYGEGFFDPPALFMGTVATATSVGLTARVLSDKHKMDTAEGATILSGAVIDDVIGLVCLAVVLGVAARETGAGRLDWAHLAWIAAKALLFWVATMAVGILCARRVASFLKVFGSTRAIAIMALAMAFLLAALAEKAGLALIIGAYTMGLSLSQLDRVHELQDRLRTIHDLLVPIFFCVTGMMVDLRTLPQFFGLGLVFTAVGVVAKVVGCGAPACLLGFNLRGAARIGTGMVPRQEVALIAAGVGLAAGILNTEMFGAVVVLAFVTTFATPPLLAALFTDRPGLRRPERTPPRATESFRVALPTPEVAELVAGRMVNAFRQEEFFTHYRPELRSYEMRKADLVVFMQVEDSTLTFSATPDAAEYARIIVSEELVALRQVFHQAAAFGQKRDLRRLILGEDVY